MRERYWRSSVATVLAASMAERNAAVASESVATQFRLKHFIKGPVDLNVVARKFNADIVRKPVQSGAWLARSGPRYVINVNSKEPKTRQSFAIAHELAHLALYEATGLTAALSHDVRSKQDDEGAGEVEALCDIFASELLMPADEWANITAQFGVSIPILRRLAQAYAVSRIATARRLVEVAAWRNAIILWQTSKGPGDHHVDPIAFFRRRFLEQSSWPGRTLFDELMPASARRGKAPDTICTPALTLQLGSSNPTMFAESGWLPSRTPLLATIIVGEPHVESLYQQFWSEDALSLVGDGDLVSGRARAAKTGQLF